MRVIAGTRRGLRLTDFEGNDIIRPTIDRVKENLFNIIAPYIPGANVLDMFAGTGALSIEAVSRGAESAVLCDKADFSINIIKKNLQKADFGDRCTLFEGDSIKYIQNTDKKFDVIFLDPPYRTGLLKKAADEIAKAGILEKGGIIAAECSADDIPETNDRFEILRQKCYGKVYIIIYTLK